MIKVISLADTHVIKATSSLTWEYNGQSSDTNGDPLVVGDLKIGDIVEVQIPRAPHGFVTIKKNPGAPATEIKDPVLACGEASSAKPNAVLKEIDCGAESKFGVKYVGSMKLEVLSTFKDDVDFWCVVHTDAMTGTLKLK